MIILELVDEGTVLGCVHLPDTANMYAMKQAVQKSWKKFMKTQDCHSLVVPSGLFMECLRQAGFIVAPDERVQTLELPR